MRIAVLGLLLSLLAPTAFGGETPVTVPKAILSAHRMSPQSRDDLFWFFCSSRAWRVLDDVGAIVATPRDQNTILPHSMGADPYLHCIVRVRFSAYTRGSPAWLKSGNVTLVQAKDESITVSVNRDQVRDNIGLYSSRLLLSLGDDLWVEVFEVSRKEQRDATAHALNVLADMFALVANGRKMAEKQLIDDGSIITQTSAVASFPVHGVTVKQVGSDEHEYEMSGYLNLGEPGFIQVAIEDVQTGSLRNTAKKHRTVEWPGWSNDPLQSFYFAVPVVVDGDGAEEQVRLRHQFSPRNERILMTTNAVLRTWTR